MKKLFLILWLALAVPICPTYLHATVAVNDARVVATGNGSTTAFPFDFRILDQTHIVVYVGGAVRTLSTHYTVSGVGAANGGTVTFVTAPGSGTQVLFLRNVPLNQLSTYIPNEAFPSARIERDYDKLWMSIQQMNERLARTPSLGVTSTAFGISITDPAPLQVLRWNSSGTGIESAIITGGGGGGGGSGGAFDLITSGTNTGASMVVGSGASLSTFGTGTIRANRTVCTGTDYLKADGTCQSIIGIGAVRMVHDNTASAWTVYKPDGTVLDVTGTTSQGLQEALNFAGQNAYPLFVYGGGVTPPAQGSSARSRILVSQPITIPTGWGNSYYFYGADLWWTGSNSVDFLTFNSMDYTTFEFQGQIAYNGNQAAIRFNPTANNGESFVGITSSKIHIGTVAVTNPTTGAVEGTHGIGVRFTSTQNGSLSPTNGNGLIINNEITIGEINGGTVGIQIDDPVGTGKFYLNRLSSPAIHGQGSYGITVGQSAASAAKVYGNIMDLTIALGASGIAISTWAQEDIYRLSINGGATGVYLNTSATKNAFTIAHNTATTKVTDGATVKDNAFGVGSVSKTGSGKLFGDVTFTGGTNVTLTQTGNDITIESSGAGLTGLTPNFGMRATGPTAATTSTLFRDTGAEISFGDVSTKSLAFSYTAAPSGLSTVALPNSANPVVVGGIANPSDSNCVLYITTAGAQVRGACGGGAGDMLLGTTQTVTATKIFGDALLQTVNPRITTGIKDANNNPLFSFIATPSADSGFQFSNGTTASPTVSLAAYGAPADINFSVSPKGAGVYCVGPCPIGQATGIQYVGALKLDGSLAGTITLNAPATVSPNWNFTFPPTKGANGQFLKLIDANGATDWATVSGTGTLQDLVQTYSAGILSLSNTGTHFTTTGTWAWTVLGTSGGVPYFSSSSTWASSGTLTAGMPVLGGGAGTAPTVGTKSGDTNKFGTVGSTQVAGKQATFDSAGNIISSAFDVNTAAAAGDVTAAAAFAVIGSVIVADTTGKAVKASGVIVDGLGNVTISGGLALNGVTNPCITGTAGCTFWGQGTPPTSLGTTGVTIYAPASVTSYKMIWPPAAPAGDRLLQVSATGQMSFVPAGIGTGDALTSNPLSQFASTTSTQLAGVLSDEVGTSGGFVRSFGINSSLLADTNVDLGSASSQWRALYLLSKTVDVNGAVANFYKSRAGVAISSGDGLGRLNFWGHDGIDYVGPMARINVVSTGTIGTNRVPTTMVFSTATDASPSVLTTALTLGANQAATFVGPITTPAINVTKIANLTSNGCISTSGGDGTLSVAGCTALTGVSSDGTVFKQIYDGNTGGGVSPRGFVVDAIDATAHSAHVGCLRAHGTRGSPTALAANDYTCAFVAHGADGFGNYPMTGFISWVVKGTPTNGVVDSYAIINAGMVDALKVEAVFSSYSKVSTPLGDLNLVGASGNVCVGADSLTFADAPFCVKKITTSTGITNLVNISNNVNANFHIDIANDGDSDLRARIGPSSASTSLVLATGNNERMRISSAGLVSIESLKTAGSAGSKRVVCADIATGILYISSTGTDCSN